jgi:sugar/nucleoside kinase (ribokinase family)
MATIIVRVETDDVDRWYAEHMTALPAFRAAGVVSEVMYSDRDQPNARVGVLEVEDVERFFGFLAQAAGPSRYRPTLWVLDEMERTI